MAAEESARQAEWRLSVERIWLTAARAARPGAAGPGPEHARLLDLDPAGPPLGAPDGPTTRLVAHELRCAAALLEGQPAPALAPSAQLRAGLASGQAVRHLLDDLSDRHPSLARGLGAPGAVVLDVGVGVGGLPAGILPRWPELCLVGVDVDRGTLAVAAEVCARAGVRDRVELVHHDICSWHPTVGVELAWLAPAALAAPEARRAFDVVCSAVNPGGWVLLSCLLPAQDVAAPSRLTASVRDWRLAVAGRARWDLDGARQHAESLGLAVTDQVVDPDGGTAVLLARLPP